MQFGLQLKYAVSYFAIILICLVFINILPVVSSRNLLFRAKYSSMQNQASLIASSLSSLSALRPEEVRKIMELLDEVGLSRVIVADEEARIVYDSTDNAENAGKYVLFPELVLALTGKNVFYARLEDGAVSGRASIPVVNRGQVVGAVYLYEYDTAQAALVASLQRDLLRISLAVSGAAVLLSLLLAALMTVRMRALLGGIRGIGAGRYDARVPVHGRDELSQLGSEINVLADRLQQTEAMRQRFVSDASHELKTPLSAITLLSDSIVQNDGMDRATILEFVGDIGREAERLGRVTQKLLELTRLGSAARETRESVDLKRVCEEALKMLRSLAEEQGIALESRLDEGCRVYANADDLHQVVFNLAENAVKYNVPGGLVRLLLYRKDQTVHLLVDDTGVGVPPDKLPHIFDRFYRVDESRTGEKSGSGLGLSIVRDTVEKHGGTVEAALRESGGMRFTVLFPALTGDKGAGGV